MSDSPLLAFAIGSLAASRGASETARLAASVMVPRAPSVDVGALIQAIQEQEQYIAEQGNLIDQLRHELSEWKEYGAETERRRAKLETYANWADAELKKHGGKG